MRMEKNAQDIESQVLLITRQFLAESGANRAMHHVALESELESELGIGSLERSELFSRFEKSFNIQFPDSVIFNAKQLKDISSALHTIHTLTKPKRQKGVPALEMSAANPAEAESLIDVLRIYVETDPERPHIYFEDDSGQEKMIRYGELYTRSQKVAASLIERGLRQSETVAIMLPTAFEFFYVFFGVLLAGGVPVPIYPPFRADQIEAYAKREALILRNAGVRFLVTFHEAAGLSKLLKAFIPSLLDIPTAAELLKTSASAPHLTLNSQDFAMIQYTSGSTGHPKGVLLNHGNLLSNIRLYGEAIQVQPQDVAVSWLPLYHDMGLIGSWLGSLYYGIPLILMSPLSFLSRPERWLWAMHYHRGTLSAGPNFAYELCIKKIEDASIAGLDLSAWRLAFNGAEMTSPHTMRRFTKRFKKYGFKETAFLPAYGLAESCLVLTLPKLNQPFHTDRIKRSPFEKDGQAIMSSEEDKNYYEFVSCGYPLDRHEMRIVQGQDQPVAERIIGRIQFRGPSTMQGYYRNPDATKAVYHNGWWESGDLGYIAEGALYVTGRAKDLIIKAGRNYYPAEIEEIVSLCHDVRQECIAAFGVRDENTGTEKLIIVAELNHAKGGGHEQIRKEIINHVVANFGIAPDEVFLLRPGAIPKTSSGKLRRSECKQVYLSGELSRRGLPITVQIIKLFSYSTFQKCKRSMLKLGKLIFTAYAGIIVLCTLLPTWGVMSIVSRRRAQNFLHHWSRWVFRLMFCPIRIKELKAHEGKKIYVVNHTSYLDTLILLAVLPSPIGFVGKKELLGVPFVRRFLKYLDFIPIDRLDFSKSDADIKNIESGLKKFGIVIFPEGTFSYATGIRPFKSGAFKIAAETGSAICPVAIRGARTLLRAGSGLLRPNLITVTLCEPLIPKNNDWATVVQLRERARECISEYSGEKPVDFIFAEIAKE